MPEVVGTFFSGQRLRDLANGPPQRIDGPDGCFPQQRLRLREHHLDRVQVGAVGRQEQQSYPGGLKGVANAGSLVDRQVVHDQDIAARQAGNNLLLDVGDEQ